MQQALAIDQQDMVSIFMAVAGTENMEFARDFLESNSWQLELSERAFHEESLRQMESKQSDETIGDEYVDSYSVAKELVSKMIGNGRVPYHHRIHPRATLEGALAPATVLQSVCDTISRLYQARDWQGLEALEVEACAVADELRVAEPEAAAVIYNILGMRYQLLGQNDQAVELFKIVRAIAVEVNDRAGVAKACKNLGRCFFRLEQFDQAICQYDQVKVIDEQLGDRVGMGKACNNLGNCYFKLGQLDEAVGQFEQARASAQKLARQADLNSRSLYTIPVHWNNGTLALGQYSHNLGTALAKRGDLEVAACALARGARAFQSAERAEGAMDFDDSPIKGFDKSFFEQQQKCYSVLECVLLGQGRKEWALAVTAQAKARALSHRLGAGAVCCFTVSEETASFLDFPALGVVAEEVNHLNPLVRDGLSAEQQAASACPTELSTDVLSALDLFLSNRRDGACARSSKVDSSEDHALEAMCGPWWEELRGFAQKEGYGTRILEFSFVLGDDFFDSSVPRLAIWVLSGAGELLTSVTVSTSLSSGGGDERTLWKLLDEARKSLKAKGRDASSPVEFAVVTASSERCKMCQWCCCKLSQCVCVHKGNSQQRETALLRELYKVLMQPVEQHLVGAEELLIVPHRELFEVPWAALIDTNGLYLIDRHVLRVAPSLRVASRAADNVLNMVKGAGHVLVVGNPLPIPDGFSALPFAEEEADRICGTLRKSGVFVRDFLKADRATKNDVRQSLQGARWAHFACHGDLRTDSLVLAIPTRTDAQQHSASARIEEEGLCFAKMLEKFQFQRLGDHLNIDKALTGARRIMESKLTHLSMNEVQGNGKVAGVQLVKGATVVLSACDTGRGEISDEGVIGLARAFLLAGAAATIVSLWSVDDRSTAVLMEYMYKHLLEGSTVPQALRHAMLCLAQRPSAESGPRPDLPEAWKRPMHWAGFLAVGASTRLI